VKLFVVNIVTPDNDLIFLIYLRFVRVKAFFQLFFNVKDFILSHKRSYAVKGIFCHLFIMSMKMYKKRNHVRKRLPFIKRAIELSLAKVEERGRSFGRRNYEDGEIIWKLQSGHLT
jgi:hypothetical protein